MSISPNASWRLVVPVKGGHEAKSRLHPPGGVSRRLLAWAIAQDCLTAACAGMPRGGVHVVTADPGVASFAEGLGAAVVADPGRGLNEAVRAGVRAATSVTADSAGAWLHPAKGQDRTAGLAVLLGDLPALRPDDLVAALSAAAQHSRAVVPDADGSGTVLLTARDRSLEPSFGTDSAARHTAAGHHRLDLDLPRLRTDVDDDRSLAAAAALGLGPATRACLGGAGATLPDMQASVHTFDAQTGAGTALLDDGRLVSFPAEVFGRSALRHLRPGQRISIELAVDPAEVSRLWIVGIGDDQRIG